MKLGIGDAAILKAFTRPPSLAVFHRHPGSTIPQLALSSLTIQYFHWVLQSKYPILRVHIREPAGPGSGAVLLTSTGPLLVHLWNKVFWDAVKRSDGSLAGMQGTIGTARP